MKTGNKSAQQAGEMAAQGFGGAGRCLWVVVAALGILGGQLFGAAAPGGRPWDGGIVQERAQLGSHGVARGAGVLSGGGLLAVVLDGGGEGVVDGTQGSAQAFVAPGAIPEEVGDALVDQGAGKASGQEDDDVPQHMWILLAFAAGCLVGGLALRYCAARRGKTEGYLAFDRFLAIQPLFSYSRVSLGPAYEEEGLRLAEKIKADVAAYDAKRVARVRQRLGTTAPSLN
jgi:hypothetical protein